MIRGRPTGGNLRPRFADGLAVMTSPARRAGHRTPPTLAATAVAQAAQAFSPVAQGVQGIARAMRRFATEHGASG